MADCLHILVKNEVAFLAYTNETIYSVGYQEGLDGFKKRLLGKCEIIDDANTKAVNLVKEAILDAKTQAYELKLVAEKELKEQ